MLEKINLFFELNRLKFKTENYDISIGFYTGRWLFGWMYYKPSLLIYPFPIVSISITKVK